MILFAKQNNAVCTIGEKFLTTLTATWRFSSGLFQYKCYVRRSLGRATPLRPSFI